MSQAHKPNHASGSAKINKATERSNIDLEDTPQTELLATISHKEERKLAARQEGRQNAWFGLGMFGLIGWSVAVPVVASIALGLWIDSRWPSRFSWTLMLLFLGIVLGCFNAWHWLTREHSQIE